MFRIITIAILCCVIGIPTAMAGETKTRSKTRMVKTAPVTAQKKVLSSKEQSALIKREMQKLGFQVSAVQPKGGNNWNVQISGFNPGQVAGDYKGAISVATQKMGSMGAVMNDDGEDAPTGNPEDPDGGGDDGDGGGEDAPTNPDDDPSSRWNMNALSPTRSVSRNATLNVGISEAGLIVINQESLGQAGFAAKMGGGLCDMFSCMAPMLDTGSLPAPNSAAAH